MYTRNIVPDLLSGKTVSRALRSYQLLDLVLNTILLEDLLPELDVNFSVIEKVMAEAKNCRLDISNAIKCHMFNEAENVLSVKKKLSAIIELLPYDCNICT